MRTSFAPFQRAMTWTLIVAGAALTVWRIREPARTEVFPSPSEVIVSDFIGCLLPAAAEYATTGHLYHPESPLIRLPGGGGYKWPPTFAALLQPFVHVEAWKAAAVFRWCYIASCLLALVLVAATWRVGSVRTALMVLVLLNWQPFWESLYWMQPEPLVALLFTLSVLWARSWSAGVPIGVAAAVKVYPCAVALFFLARRRWAAVAATVGGASLATGLAFLAIRPGELTVFVTKVLPYQNAVSLNPENLTLPGAIGRLSVLVIGPQETRRLPGIGMAQLRKLQTESKAVQWSASAAWLLVASAAVLALVWAWKRRDREDLVSRVPRESVGVAAVVCMVLFLQSTAWPQYQIGLLPPVFVAISALPARDAAGWALLAAAMLPALLMGLLTGEYGEFGGRHPQTFSLLRGLTPVGVWCVLLRVLADRAYRTTSRVVLFPSSNVHRTK